jgi:hypothetical protein
MHRTSTTFTFLAASLGMLLLAGCGRAEGTNGAPREANLDIRTPVGGMTVRTDISTDETGLTVYPGAVPLREDREGDRAGVKMDTPLFGFAVAAAKFESADAPEAVVDFYRNAMGVYGQVVTCKGDIDFGGAHGERLPQCSRDSSDGETQLVVGTEDAHRLVAVKPRGTGSEFALVSIQTQQRH